MNQDYTNPQKVHYERIHTAYEDHYYDRYSMQYRDEIIFKELFDGINFNGKKVAELACGSGYNSQYLINIFSDIIITGFDISKKAVESYKKLTNRHCEETDLTKIGELNESYKAYFDVVFIVGGVHHCVNNLSNTMHNVEAILKPGGLFLMFEPNKEFLMESLRKVWYKVDHYFEESSERALSHYELINLVEDKFTIKKIIYSGWLGYFLIYNSLLFRLNKRIKGLICKPLIIIDKIFNLIPLKYLFPYFIAHWQKNKD